MIIDFNRRFLLLDVSWGVDVRALPRLAAEQDFIMRKKKVRFYAVLLQLNI